MLGGLLSPLGGLLGDVNSVVNDVLEEVSPGSTDGLTLTGNLLNEKGVTGDLASNLEEGSITNAIQDAYADVIGPGGAVNNLAEGGGLGTEGLVDNLLDGTSGLLG